MNDREGKQRAKSEAREAGRAVEKQGAPEVAGYEAVPQPEPIRRKPSQAWISTAAPSTRAEALERPGIPSLERGHLHPPRDEVIPPPDPSLSWTAATISEIRVAPPPDETRYTSSLRTRPPEHPMGRGDEGGDASAPPIRIDRSQSWTAAVISEIHVAPPPDETRYTSSLRTRPPEHPVGRKEGGAWPSPIPAFPMPYGSDGSDMPLEGSSERPQGIVPEGGIIPFEPQPVGQAKGLFTKQPEPTANSGGMIPVHPTHIPLFIPDDTDAAKNVNPWLKSLTITPSFSAVIEAMSTYAMGRAFLPDHWDWMDKIYKLGMAKFYGDKLFGTVLAELKTRYTRLASLAQDAGIFLSRNLIGDGYWEIVEPTKNKYHWEIFDAILQAANSAGGQPLIVSQPIAVWDQLLSDAGKDEVNPKKRIKPPSPNDFMLWGLAGYPQGIYPINDMTAFGSYLHELALYTNSVFSGTKVYFEVFNEMDISEQPYGATNKELAEKNAAKYVQILDLCRKRLGTNAYISAGASWGWVGIDTGLTGNPDLWWKTFATEVSKLESSGTTVFDAINFHVFDEWYDPDHPSSFASVEEYHDRLENRMDYFRKLLTTTKDIWITEYVLGDPRKKDSLGNVEVITDATELEERVAAGYLMRFAVAAAKGAKKIFVEFYNPIKQLPEDSPLDSLARSGMVYLHEGTYYRQLVYYTQKLMNYMLSGFVECKNINPTGDRNQFKFIFKNKNPVYVLWCSEDENNKLVDPNVPAALVSNSVKVTDIYGKSQTMNAGAKVSSLCGIKTYSPVFVVIPGAFPLPLP
jgi:hypothetical protein